MTCRSKGFELNHGHSDGDPLKPPGRAADTLKKAPSRWGFAAQLRMTRGSDSCLAVLAVVLCFRR